MLFQGDIFASSMREPHYVLERHNRTSVLPFVDKFIYLCYALHINIHHKDFFLDESLYKYPLRLISERIDTHEKNIVFIARPLPCRSVACRMYPPGNGPQETTAGSEGKPDRMRTALSAPTESSPYSVLEFGYSDSVSGTLHTMEYTYWSRDRFTDSGAAKTKRMSVGGMVCTGSYVDSDYETYNTFATARYLDQNQKLFEVDDRGLLTSYFWGSSGLQTTGGTCSQEELP